MKTLRMLTTLLVCLAILFAFFISIIQLFGFDLYGVLTGSMKPAIPPGSMIYLRDADPDTLRIGDVITYSVSPNIMATHRIVDIIPDENNPSFFRFQTKGDANPAVDAVLVEPKKIIGKVAFSIPLLGSVAHFIQKPPGIFVAIGIGIALIAMVILTDATPSEKKASLRQKKSCEEVVNDDHVNHVPNHVPETIQHANPDTPSVAAQAAFQPAQTGYECQRNPLGQSQMARPVGYAPCNYAGNEQVRIPPCQPNATYGTARQPWQQQPQLPPQGYYQPNHQNTSYARQAGMLVCQVAPAQAMPTVYQQRRYAVQNTAAQSNPIYVQQSVSAVGRSPQTASQVEMVQSRRRRSTQEIPVYH